MQKLFKRAAAEQSGQALVIVLAMLALGGLTAVPMLNYAGTSVKTNNNFEAGMKGTYAAEAGVESVIWSIENNAQVPTSLSSGPNSTSVAMQTSSQGVYTLYFGELIQTSGHYDYLRLQHSIVWDQSAQAYKYTISVTPHGTPSTIYITGIGARLPPGYTYVANSANSFSANLSRAEPQITEDEEGAQMVNWQFSKVKVDSGKTQTFYITGTGDIEGEYTWVVANRSDIGQVGELSGGLYTITSTATGRDGQVSSKITSNVMNIGGSVEVISWQIAK